mgnify:CR=1 FL=1
MGWPGTEQALWAPHARETSDRGWNSSDPYRASRGSLRPGGAAVKPLAFQINFEMSGGGWHLKCPLIFRPDDGYRREVLPIAKNHPT